MSDSVLDIARDLRTTLDANAAKATGSALCEESVAALVSAGLFGIMTPEEVGGCEQSINDAIDVFAEISRADGSTGWCLMAGASTIAYFGAYAEDAFVEEVFADGVPLAAGQFAPKGIGTPDGDGYRLNGGYQFGSGISYAEWVGAGFLVPPKEGSDAPAEFLFTIVPRSEVNVQGNWDVLGLVNTASYDYELKEVYTPKAGTFLFAAPTRRRGSKLFEIGVIGLTAAGHAGFAIGVARRALDELRSIAKTKVRMGAVSFLKDSESYLLSLGSLESRLEGARAWVRTAFADIEQYVHAHGRVDPVKNNVVRQATVFVTQEAADIVRQAYLLAGTTGLRDGVLQRCFRDIHAGSQHFFASPASTLDFARNLMDATPDTGLEAE